MSNVRTSVLVLIAAVSIAGNAALVGYQWWNTEPEHVAAEPELIIVTIDGKRVADSAVEQAAAKLLPGRYMVQAIPKPGEVGWTRQIVVSGDGPTPPDPPEPPDPPVPPPPVVPVVVPSPQLQAAVAGVKAASASNRTAAAYLAKAHADFATALKATPGVIKTSGQLKADLQRFHESIRKGNEGLGSVPGLSAGIEAAFDSTFGEDDAAVTDAQAVAFIEALAWAMGGK